MVNITQLQCFDILSHEHNKTFHLMVSVGKHVGLWLFLEFEIILFINIEKCKVIALFNKICSFLTSLPSSRLYCGRFFSF